MKKYFQLFGAAALLTASLFTINETAKAESMETFTIYIYRAQSSFQVRDA